MNNYPFERSAKAPMGFAQSAPVMQSSFVSALPENPVVAMAYIPFQTDTTAYDEMKALKSGTLFPILDKPFMGRGAR